ncbi:MAG: ATPase [Deltaproteobacteria bacterium]|nr:MAG: ATPase [Deltaproteobacteria bacterium]
MISVDGSLIIQIINFVALIFILNAVLYKPIRQGLAERKTQIEGLEQSVKAALEGADETEAAYKEGIKGARVEGMKQKERLIAEGEAEEARLMQQINEKAAADLAELKASIAREADAAKAELEKEVGVFAEAIFSKILGRAA